MSKKKYRYEPSTIAGWREKALAGETLTAIARAATEESGHPVGPRAVKNRLLTTYPTEIAVLFQATAFSDVSHRRRDEDAAPSPHAHYGIKDAGHPDTWSVLIADMPSLAHLVGRPYEDVVRATQG